MEIQNTTNPEAYDWGAAIEKFGNSLLGLADKGIAVYDRLKTGSEERRALRAQGAYYDTLATQGPSQPASKPINWTQIAVGGAVVIAGVLAIVFISKKL